MLCVVNDYQQTNKLCYDHRAVETPVGSVRAVLCLLGCYLVKRKKREKYEKRSCARQLRRQAPDAHAAPTLGLASGSADNAPESAAY